MSINLVEVDRGRFEIRENMVSILEGIAPIYESDLREQAEAEMAMSMYENGLEYA